MERSTIRRFRGQEHLTDKQIAYLEFENINEKYVAQQSQLFDPLMSHIFAPDPVTGWPCSSLSVVLNSNTPSEIKQYIEQNMRINTTHQHETNDEVALMDGLQATSRRAQYGAERQANIDGLRKLIDTYKQSDMLNKP